jgi:hypothetical protein
MIRLSERAANPDGSFVVRVEYPVDGSAYDVTVTDPASEADEKLFAWYFEEHLRYPFLDLDHRAEAVAWLTGSAWRRRSRVGRYAEALDALLDACIGWRRITDVSIRVTSGYLAW